MVKLFCNFSIPYVRGFCKGIFCRFLDIFLPEPERTRPDGMGAGGEQPDGTGGGNSASGDRLQVGQEKQKEEKEQETAGGETAAFSPLSRLFPGHKGSAGDIGRASGSDLYPFLIKP